MGSDFQLRIASRLSARQRELDAAESAAVKRLHEREMYEADRFLQAFDMQQQLAYLGRDIRAVNSAASDAGYSGPLPGPTSAGSVSRRRAAEAASAQAAYLDELMHASPEGFAAALRALSG